ncbi:hypothetical protein [Dactylosporangium sp. NPDC049140]|uniref:hypothetical protein n=1 Tax=Dactylosporangium sp. NPDC049140 TaxID=3155647 RepID=UPI0033D7A522
MRLHQRIKTAFVAAAVVGGTLVAPSAAHASSDCYVDGSYNILWCGNVYNAPLRSSARNNANVVDHLHTTWSYFGCWVYGDWHSGGNNVWYLTEGDQYGNFGYVAAVYVYTDVDPFPGHQHC